MLYGNGKYIYQLVEDWAQLREGLSFLDVGSIAIDNQDRVYILNRSENPVMVFDRDGNLLTSWGRGYFKRAHGICVGPDGSIYCTDDRNHTVTKFNAHGEVLMTLGTKDKPSDTGYRDVPDLWERIASIKRGGPPFNRPTGVALSSTGDMYVSDGYGNARIHKFSQDGKLLFSWGEPGPAPGQFRLPHSIWVDRQDRVWVADRENNRIQIFNDKGEFLAQWTDLIRPTDVFVDNDEIVYVSELCKRISIFATDGKLLARWGNENHDVNDPLFVAPHAIAIDSKGDLYVGEVAMTHTKIDRGSRAVQKFARKN
ncbi:MAG: peptidyl-alpha-hydroxyglycine alpha-amidating lyase family protein [Candidatus Geothermarchaeales archaeon]